MKKYLIASVVAMMAFAFAAFAASLTVNAGTLQAGEDTNLQCAENATIAWGNTNNSDTGGGFVVQGLSVDFDGACDGKFAYVALGDADQEGFGIQEIDGDSVAFTTVPILVEDINYVRVMVKDTNDSAPGTYFVNGWITGPTTP